MSKHFKIDVFDDVYPPSEDTYLLLDSVDIRRDDEVLDVGCGAGLGTVIAASRARRTIGLDVSLRAVKNTRRNLEKNGFGGTAEVLQSDLLSAISRESKFSIILFNPPYLPADEDHVDMDHAHVGGEEGSELTERFIPEASRHLRKNGQLFLVVSTLENQNAIKRLLEQNGFDTECVAEKSMFFERIQVLKGSFLGHKETVL